jgi:hypothetical protein
MEGSNVWWPLEGPMLGGQWKVLMFGGPWKVQYLVANGRKRKRTRRSTFSPLPTFP